MKIYCIFCKKEIKDPDIGRITCGNEVCVRKLQRIHKDFYYIGEEGKEKLKKYNKEYYKKKKEKNII